MKTKLLATLGVCTLLLTLPGCNKTETPPPTEMSASTKAVPSEISGLDAPGLFLETDSTGPIENAPYIARHRFTKLNWALLIDESGQPLNLGADAEITLNLFPDVVYTGVIKQIGDDGGSISWIGYLKDIEYSEMTMVLTGGAFIAQIASPAGVYEVSLVGDDLYRVIMIDQTKLPGGEGNIEGTGNEKKQVS